MANKVKALQQWCRQQVLGYRDVNVTNMTSSWKSGLAFCALIHKYRPDLIDYDSLSKEDVYENNELAFRVAKEQLNIPDLLDAEDMVAMAVPDKLCIVTYVSQYYNVLRSLTPAGGPGIKKSPTKRPQSSEVPGVTEPKRISTEPIKSHESQAKGTSATRSGHKNSMGDKCYICHQKVYLMERHLEAGKLYHRHCFRESQKSSFRAYRGTRHIEKQESKENISPKTSSNITHKPTNQHNGATNTTTSNTNGTKGMAKFWDAKVAGTKSPPSSSSTNSSPSLSGVSSPRSHSPESNLRTFKLSTPEDTDTQSKSYRDNNFLKGSAKPKPTSITTSRFTQQEKQEPPTRPLFSPVPPSSSAGTSPPLSAGAAGLFPHFSQTNKRNIPSAPVECMEVDTDTPSLEFSAASVKRSGTRQPPSQFEPSLPNRLKPTTLRNPIAASASQISPSPSPASSSPTSPPALWSPTPVSGGERGLGHLTQSTSNSNEASIVSGLLSSLSHVRQRHDTKKDLPSPPSTSSTPSTYTASGENPFTGGAQQQKPSSISSITNDVSPKSPQSPTKYAEQRRSILKFGSGGTESNFTSAQSSTSDLPGISSSNKGPRPILKHKDNMSVSVCDPPKASDSHNTPLRSILKPGTDSESMTSLESSPRSILKRPDEHEDEGHVTSGHGILKTPDITSGSDSTHDSMSPRSILKTGLHDTDLSINLEDSPRPGKSILKSRKYSGDSLLSSSGDELEEISPRPILKTSPRSESVVSPTSDRKSKSILKTKVMSSKSPTHSQMDSPKPILKSRESSPAPISSSPLRVAEPTKPILKKVEVPTPTGIPLNQPNRGPSGPSLLRTHGSEEEARGVSSFAAFKSSPTKSYTSNLGLSDRDTSMSAASAISQNIISIDKKAERKADASKSAPTQRLLNTNISQPSGAKIKTDAFDTSAKPKYPTISAKPEEKPEWMLEAEKRQAARAGKYQDPEKKYLENGKGSTLSSPGRSFSPPTSLINGASKKKASTIDRPKPFVRKTSPKDEPMEVDTRPEWQKEAEKRQVNRKGYYPDPEKMPIRNKTPEPETVLSNPKDSISKLAPARPTTAPSEANKALGRDRLKPGSAPLPGGLPPPKPIRSPLPQRGFRGSSSPAEEETLDGTDQTGDRERLVAIRKHPSILQRNKKNPPPPRPDHPPQMEKKKIIPGTEFKFSPIRGKGSSPGSPQTSPSGDGLYAEVGPPSRKKPPIPSSSSESPKLNRFSQRPLPPLPKGFSPTGDDTPTPKRKVQAEVHIEPSALISRLEDLDVHLQALEQEGRILEEKIRSESDDAMDEADLMIAWFELVNQKNELVRQESDLMYRQRQQDLESQHEELEYELRCLMQKSDEEKMPSDRIREEALLQELIETVVLRNNIVDCIEEDRIRYLEEDENIAVMMHAKGLSLKDDSLLDCRPTKKRGKDKKKKEKEKKKNRRDVKSSYN